MRYLRKTPYAAVSGLLLCLSLGSLPGAATAQSAFPYFDVSGYGTIGYSILDEENVEYRTGEALDGADTDGSFELDTRLALQLDAVFTPQWSAALQGVVRESEDGDPAAQIEWGFLRWLPTNNLEVRAGRMSLPVFANSDFREVGYAIAQLRPPEDVYTVIPLRRFEGADITYDTQIGGQSEATLLRFQLYAGRAREKIFEQLEPDAKNIIGTNLQLERGPLTVRLGYVSADLDIDSGTEGVTQVRNGIVLATNLATSMGSTALVEQLNSIAEDFAGERVPMRFAALGARLDFNRFFADAEYVQRRVENWVPDVDSYSITVGTRYRSLRPYVFASAMVSATDDLRVSFPAPFGMLEDGINLFYEPRDQQAVGIGTRWDITPNFALKGQVERLSRDVRGTSFLRLDVDRFSEVPDPGEDVTLFSVVLDFVF